jgi:hypothetical protein
VLVDDEGRVKSKKTVKPRPETPVVKTPIELAEQKAAVTRRLVEKFVEKPATIYSFIDSNRRSQSLLKKVLSELWDTKTGPEARSWMDDTLYDALQWHAWCHFNRIDRKAEVIGLLQGWDCWEQFKPAVMSLLSADSSDEAMANAHNKRMHISNGNILAQTQSDVDAAPAWRSMLAKPTTLLPRASGVQLASTLRMTHTTDNLTHGGLIETAGFVADYVDDTNTIQRSGYISLPNTYLYPREVRDANEVLEDHELVVSASPLPYITTVASEDFDHVLENTEMANELERVITRQSASSWRRDVVNLTGYSMFDLFQLSLIKDVPGLTMESCALKLELLHSLLAHADDSVPHTCYTRFDTATRAIAPVQALSYNNSPVPTERCGGAENPIFPFSGGAGTLTFHLSGQTVPVSARTRALYFPQELLSTNSDVQRMLSLFVAMWAEWPFCLFQVDATTRNASASGAEVQTFIPMQTTTLVHGERDMHIILPRRRSEEDPKTQAAAERLASLNPYFGPQGSAAHPANEDIRINWIGRPVTEEITVGLTDYLCSWCLTWDVTDVAEIVGRLNMITPMGSAMESAHDMVIEMCDIVPPLLTSDATAPAYGHPSEISVQAAHRVSQMECYSAAVWPVHESRWNYRVYDSDPLAWNKVCLRLAIPVGMMPSDSVLPKHLAQRDAVFQGLCQGIMHRAAWQVAVGLIGVSAEGWDGFQNNILMRTLSSVCSKFFAKAEIFGQIVPGSLSMLVTQCFRTLYSQQPASITIGKNARGYDLNCFGRWGWSGRSSCPVSAGGQRLTGYLPCTLVDAWVTMPADAVPAYMSSFPPPGGLNSMRGYTEGLESVRTATLVSTYDTPGGTNFYQTDQIPQDTDHARWNRRLAWTTPGSVITDVNGGVVPGLAVAAPGSYPTQRAEVLPPGVNTAGLLVRAATCCLPTMVPTGQRVYVMLPAQQAPQHLRVCFGQSRESRPAWIFSSVAPNATELRLAGVKDVFTSAFGDSVFQQGSGASMAESLASAGTQTPATSSAPSEEVVSSTQM